MSTPPPIPIRPDSRPAARPTVTTTRNVTTSTALAQRLSPHLGHAEEVRLTRRLSQQLDRGTDHVVVPVRALRPALLPPLRLRDLAAEVHVHQAPRRLQLLGGHLHTLAHEQR